MRQLFPRDQMAHKLTAIGHRTASNIEQIPYRIVSYKGPEITNIKQFKRENLQSYVWMMDEIQISNT